ncbi:hypothetical protein L3X38_008068 [Prunus dulcis]|uniref:Uncharacterized protein n=1 Tax=Prunus dulcis TaxID=3755 RepID=A0AAD5F6R6_PRUDU|nr:hypothetical protein L3X38_008068 [Prunus dulcis]
MYCSKRHRIITGLLATGYRLRPVKGRRGAEDRRRRGVGTMNYVAPLSGTRGKTTPRHASCAACLDHGDGTRSKHATKREHRNPTRGVL